MSRLALHLGVVSAGVLMLGAGGALAQGRPSDENIFGSSDAPPATATLTSTSTSTATGTSTAAGTESPTATIPIPAGGAVDARDELNLGDPNAATRFSTEVAPSDPLKIGGQVYWRAISTGKQGQYPQNWSFSAPALLDVYMDARPNDRVRAYALGRMSYDPTLAANGSTSTNTGSPTAATAGNVSAQQSDFLGSAYSQTRGPNVFLDQMWLSADIGHTVFVTAGKQHVRWGTARFWTPTDYLHMQPRNPLLPFDARAGTTMLKLHVPWEAKGWNFYAYALPEGPAATPTTGDVSAAARAEVVLGTLEAGLGVFGNRNSKTKFAGDVSFGVWDLDFYGEAALRNAGDVDFVTFDNQGLVDASGSGTGPFSNKKTKAPVDVTNTASLVDAYFPSHRGSGWKPQVTGGVSYTRQYADKDTFTVGAEYFYNGLGYDDPRVYPAVVFLPHSSPLANPATFFYLGKQYLGVYATAPAPYSWDNTTFTLSTLANLTDKSGITRLDYSLTVLTHLRFEAYGAVHWGQRNGEFRFGIDGSALAHTHITAVDSLAGKLDVQPAIFDLGVGLRVAL
jgi:hypothetical protein